jgi:hypothetical protein
MGEEHREGRDRTGFKRSFTVPEAAQVLGISPEAVRTRLSRGTLESVKDQGRVFVLLEHDITSSGSDITDDQTALVESLRGQVEFLQRELDRRGEAEAELRRIIAALTQRIPELEPPRETPAEASTEKPESAPGPVPNAEPARGGERRPWWRRMFGG